MHERPTPTDEERLQARVKKLEQDCAKLRAQRDRMAEFIRELGFNPTRFW